MGNLFSACCSSNKASVEAPSLVKKSANVVILSDDDSCECLNIDGDKSLCGGRNDNSAVLDSLYGPSLPLVDLTVSTSNNDGMEKIGDFNMVNDVGMTPAYAELHEYPMPQDSKLSLSGLDVKLAEQKLFSADLKDMLEELKEEVAYEPFVPLTDAEEHWIRDVLFSSTGQDVLVAHENSNIEITRGVLQCLGPGGWLNDEVINLYLELLKERGERNPGKYLKCHFFNTFFYKKLVGVRTGYDYKAVRRWTTQKRIGYGLHECDKIFVPIQDDVHWCLGVINIKEQKFQYLDSLGGKDSQVLQVLAQYLIDEVKDKSNTDLDVSFWKQDFVDDHPKQKNWSDCGIFMIKYVDFYSRGLPLCFNQDHICYFRKRTAFEILRLRAD